MQSPDPNRPHGLDDIIARMHEVQTDGASWGPSWADVERVRHYIGLDRWAKARESASNDYDLALGVLLHLEDVESARTTIAPYLECSCPHASAGTPCAYDGVSSILRILYGNSGLDTSEENDLPVPKMPLVCTRRVLAAHGKIAAAELFFDKPQTHAREWTGRQVLSISGEIDGDRAICRAQYRHPLPLSIERLYIGAGSVTTIHDVRVADKSLFGSHRDLPGFAFSSHIIGPHLAMPFIEQDQWIEIEATRVKGNAPHFYGSIVGRRIE